MLMSYMRSMKKSSTTSMMNARVLHYTYNDRGWLLSKSIYVYLCWWLIYMNVTSFDVNIMSLVSLSLKMYAEYLIIQNLYIVGFWGMLRTRMILGFNERCIPGTTSCDKRLFYICLQYLTNSLNVKWRRSGKDEL